MRTAEFIIILGTNGTGKSTITKKLAKASKRRALVIDYDGGEKTWSGLPEVDITNSEAL